MSQASRDPVLVQDERLSATSLRRSYFLPAELIWFEGHFPDEAILPGVVQLQWAIKAAAVLRTDATAPQSIQQLKFTAPIRPGMTIELKVDAAVADVITFAYTSVAGAHSSGRLQFASLLAVR
jgi:3-hydroxymyristoyl/3-hydroxydecanoyl-(acyl carrier protein) dehydratase